MIKKHLLALTLMGLSMQIFANRPLHQEETQSEKTGEAIQFFAYTPKLLYLNAEYQSVPQINFLNTEGEKSNFSQQYGSFNTNVELFLPVMVKNDWSIIHETKFWFTQTYLADGIGGNRNSMKSVNSNFLNTFLKVNRKIPLKETRSIVFSGQINYFGLDVFKYQKLGGSLTGIYYTKNTEKKSVGFGITYDMNYHMTPIIPLVIYYRKMKRDFNLEIFLPWKVGLQKIVSPTTYLYLGSKIGQDLDFIRNLNVDLNPYPHILENRTIYLKNYFSFQKALNNFIWIEVETGYNHNFSSIYTTPDTPKEMEFTNSFLTNNNFGGVYATTGIFLRPVFSGK